MYQLKIKRSALKELEKLPVREIRRIREKIRNLAEEPRPSGSTKLKGGTNEWRIRSGDYRIIYTIEDAILTVEVIDIGHRRDIYH